MSLRRKWSKTEKLNILKEAEDVGVTEVIRKHELSLATYYNWKKKVELYGKEALNQTRQSFDPEIRKLQEEISGSSNYLPKKSLRSQGKKTY